MCSIRVTSHLCMGKPRGLYMPHLMGALSFLVLAASRGQCTAAPPGCGSNRSIHLPWCNSRSQSQRKPAKTSIISETLSVQLEEVGGSALGVTSAARSDLPPVCGRAALCTGLPAGPLCRPSLALHTPSQPANSKRVIQPHHAGQGPAPPYCAVQSFG